MKNQNQVRKNGSAPRAARQAKTIAKNVTFVFTENETGEIAAKFEVPKSFHDAMIQDALAKGISLQQWVENAVTEQTAKFKTKAAASRKGHYNPRKVFVALNGCLAMKDNLFMQSMIALLAKQPCPMTIVTASDPVEESSLNSLAAEFLRSDCTHFLSIDADIGFTPADMVRIINHEESVVSGCYPLKTETKEIQWCGDSLSPAKPLRADGLQPMRFIGAGFLCVAREVFTRLIAGNLADEYQTDFPPHEKQRAFFYQGVRFDEGVKRLRFFTAGWMFCFNCQQLGIPIYADTNLILRRAGRVVWPLSLQEGNPFNKNLPAPSPIRRRRGTGYEACLCRVLCPENTSSSL